MAGADEVTTADPGLHFLLGFGGEGVGGVGFGVLGCWGGSERGAEGIAEDWGFCEVGDRVHELVQGLGL